MIDWTSSEIDWKDPRWIDLWEYRNDGRCWGCGHLKGQSHAEMCDVERCITCGHQMIGCICEQTEVCMPENGMERAFKYPFCEKKSLKWTKFSEIPTCEWFWVSDFVQVYLCNGTELHLVEREDRVWAKAEIAYPPVPEKPFHYCVRDKFICAEHRYGSEKIPVLRIHYDDESLSDGQEVQFCPFCGFKGTSNET